MKNMKIGTKLHLLVIGIILMVGIPVAIVSNMQINKAMEKVYTDRVKVVSQLGYNWLDETYPGDWSIQDGQLYKGETKMNDNNEILDQIGELTGGAATIFQGDIRIATNIKEDGQRRTDTKADPKVSDIVLNSAQTYLGEANIVGEKYLTMYQPLKDNNGEVIGMWLVGPKIKTIGKTVLSLLTAIIIVILIAGLIALIASIPFTRSIIRPLLTINKQLKDISEGEGDLTKELEVKSRDEIGDLANSFNKMLGSLRTMIRQVGVTAEQVAASSEQLTASAEETSQATNQVANSIQEVAAGAEFQGRGASESAQAMREMAIGIQQVAEATTSVSERSTETSEEARSGDEAIKRTIQQMITIQSSVAESAMVVEQLGEHSKKISQINEIITGIAEQTNLLSLNASIEAARAGEHGKGFAVVANEVKQLAEQSKESANQINDLINQIQHDTAQAMQLMEKGTLDVSAGMEVVQETGTGFQRILSSIEEVTSEIQEVSAVAEELSASVEEINASMEEMSNSAQNAVMNIQNVASASEEQLASMEEVTASASSLSKMTEELQMLVNKFKV